MAEYDIPDAGDWVDSKWSNACTWRNETYSVETSVGGKYVYGYNLPMADVDLDCEGWVKTGWWRLTFYTTDNAVRFDDPLISLLGDFFPYYHLTAPPPVPSAVRVLPRGENYIQPLMPEPYMGEAELYQPVVDTDNNLTYLDICIISKSQGGGGGGGGNGRTK